METFYIINQIPKINRAHWNLPWMSCILKFRSLKISLETLERSFHRGEKTEISREASWDIWNSPLCERWPDPRCVQLGEYSYEHVVVDQMTPKQSLKSNFVGNSSFLVRINANLLKIIFGNSSMQILTLARWVLRLSTYW